MLKYKIGSGLVLNKKKNQCLAKYEQRNFLLQIRSLFRKLQDESLNTAIYRLLRDINKNLNRIDIPTADYRRKEANFGFCLWVLVQLPTPMFNPRAPSR